MGTHRAVTFAKVIRDIVIVIGILVLIAMLAAHIHYTQTTPTTAQEAASTYLDDLNADTIRTIYPGYFKTPDEHATKAKEVLFRKITENNSQATSPDTTSWTLLLPAKRFHGCCNTSTSWDMPKRLQLLDNSWVEIVQNVPGPYNAIVNQYFETQTCEIVTNCNYNCDCHQQWAIGPAIVKIQIPNTNKQKPDLREVKWPGCCQCINNG